MSLVGVECNADRYFFGRLLGNKNLIRKERNDFEVIKGVSVRSKGNFSLGIIDVDKKKKLPVDFVIVFENPNNQIYKHINNCQFIILIGPRQFEHWINEFLRLQLVTIESFGFINFEDFMQKSKTLNPEKEIRFKSVIDFVFEKIDENESHIQSLKKQLEYILEKKYQFNQIDFLKI